MKALSGKVVVVTGASRGSAGESRSLSAIKAPRSMSRLGLSLPARTSCRVRWVRPLRRFPVVVARGIGVQVDLAQDDQIAAPV